MAKRYSSSKVGGEKMSVGRHEYNHTQRESSSERGDERDMYRAEAMQGYYEGAEPRRRQEMMDAGMIQEDPRAVANMPQMVKMTPYPKSPGYIPEGIDDTIRGVDGQMGYDNEVRKSDFHPKKV